LIQPSVFCVTGLVASKQTADRSIKEMIDNSLSKQLRQAKSLLDYTDLILDEVIVDGTGKTEDMLIKGRLANDLGEFSCYISCDDMSIEFGAKNEKTLHLSFVNQDAIDLILMYAAKSIALNGGGKA
jgi:hypothetical protein